MEISTGSVLATAFGGAALGALITGGFSIWLNRKNYKRDYYKKIIDKRIEAYQELNNFLNYMRIYNYVQLDGKNKIIQKAFISEDEYNTVLDKLKSIHESTIWLSKDLADMFYDFSNLLIYIKDYIYNEDYKIKYWLSENNKDDLLKKVEEEKEKIKNNFPNQLKSISNMRSENKIDINATGIVFFDLIKERNDAIKVALLRDFKNLYDIEDFFENKMGNKTFKILKIFNWW
ncbi:hypothetical protein DXD38_05425 [Megamonas funiformis]|jgi:hypothetical protein|uniref:hypothetical protein n=2 Tax=Megamonas funiformis TaxID=437897 RepID=UPI000E3F7D7C|nr:hypothetical protein [Megamonas funiformis]MBS7211836.1 hypothetical protein [Megamonas funiformis]RGJ98329.1 hypothetical protein DXD38_05425 [Megamonas funiformis]